MGAVAHLACLDAPLRAALAAQSVSLAYAFVLQEISNTSWSYSTMQLLHLPLLTAIAASARPKLSAFRPLALANTAWSLASLAFTPSPRCWHGGGVPLGRWSVFP